MEIEIEQFTRQELLVIALKKSDRDGVRIYSSEDAIAYLCGLYRVGNPSELAQAVCREENQPLSQIRNDIDRDEAYKLRVSLIEDAEKAMAIAEERREDELRQFSISIEEQFRDMDAEQEMQKASILNAMALTYARKLEERVRTLQAPKIYRKSR
jgi:hypothetical protein